MGSEMCIRDRVHCRGDDRVTTLVVCRDLAFFGRHDAGALLRTGCLLYTSDAADERSSVDLGGRRIIKKKKSRHAKRVRVIGMS